MAYFIPEILALLGAIDGAGTTVQFAQFLIRYLRRLGVERKAGEIRQFLEDLGNTGEHDLRAMVENWRRQCHPHCPEAQVDEVITVLLNLTRKARFLTTQGGARSSVLRSLPLIEKLISELEPTRKRGERVVPGQDWTLERFLGMGTFGEVWLARNRGYPMPRAYKFFTRRDSLTAIQSEQEALYAVLRDLGDHPNIIRFLDVAVGDAACSYIALEYAGGGSLEDWILEDPADRPALNKHDLILGLVDGLATAHSYHIYHRDLKPANVVLTDGPHPIAKITDFGLGKVTAQLSGGFSASNTLGVGTPMYMPPEAQSFHTDRDPAQDDVFALGVLWYQLLVERLERPPYDFADELATVGADSGTINMITRCLAGPKHRFRDAGGLQESLDVIGLPEWEVPSGMIDVQQLFREYHAGRSL